MKSAINNPPHTYSEWVLLIDKLMEQSDDLSLLYAMKQGTLEWQSGVAERFTKRLMSTVNYRMNNAMNKFQNEMAHSYGHEREIVRALLTLRKELKFLLDIVDLPAIPENIRHDLCQLIFNQAENIQMSLEKSAESDRSGKLLNIVRNNRINIIEMGANDK